MSVDFDKTWYKITIKGVTRGENGGQPFEETKPLKLSAQELYDVRRYLVQLPHVSDVVIEVWKDAV